ncbi:uncharacterized protein LOC144768432 [Lissotriton helveticus]
MLKIAFLVTFCGILARMAQAQVVPKNCYNVALSCDVLSPAIAKGVSNENILPLPRTPVTDQTSKAEFTDLTLASPKVNCQTRTQKGGTVLVTVTGSGTVTGNIGGPTPTNGVPCKITNEVKAPFEIGLTGTGQLQCTAPPSTNQAEVTCSSEPQSGGILSGLLGAILGLLDGLLTLLNGVLKTLLDSAMPNLLKTIQGLLNETLEKLTAEKPVGNNQICNHKVKNMTTDDNGYLNIMCESTLTNSDGTAEQPPIGTYPVAPLTPVPGSACTLLLPEEFINFRVQRYTFQTIEITGGVVDALTRAIKSVCGIEIMWEKIAFTPTGFLTVKITDSKVSASIEGTLQLFAKGNPVPFMIATATVYLVGSFEYVAPRINIILIFESMGNVKFVNGEKSCDVSYQASQTIVGKVKGTSVFKECVEASPYAKMQTSGSTRITPQMGGVKCVHFNN